MSALTPQFLADLQTNVKTVAANEYQNLLKDLWWQRVAKMLSSSSRKEVRNWLLDTAKIDRETDGSVKFQDPVMVTTEFENEYASTGLKIRKEQLTDTQNGINGFEGLDLAGQWARQVGAQAAYWPQKLVAKLIRDNPTCYTGKSFFAKDHALNPYRASFGTYANLIDASVLGGTAPAISGVSVDTAIENIQRVISYAASIKMPNGEDPRKLRPVAILHPPALASRVSQITDAKFIAQASAGGGGGSGDVSAVTRRFAFGEPIQADELGASFSGGSDTSFYMLMSGIDSNELGAIIYSLREPFSITAHNEATSAEIAKTREFQWTTSGRNAAAPGHPYLLFRVDAA